MHASDEHFTWRRGDHKSIMRDVISMTSLPAVAAAAAILAPCCQ